MGVLTVIGNVLIAAGAAFVVLGLVGVTRFKRFNMRLLAGSKVDTIALLLICLGAVLREGVSWLSAKALLIFIVVLLVNPIVTSAVAAGRRKALLFGFEKPSADGEDES